MPPVEMLEELSNMYNMTILHNRMMAYVENCIYGGKWDEYKKSIKREKNNLTFPKKKNIITSERVAKLRKSSFAARFYIANYP